MLATNSPVPAPTPAPVPHAVPATHAATVIPASSAPGSPAKLLRNYETVARSGDDTS